MEVRGSKSPVNSHVLARRQNTPLHVVDVAGRDDAITVTCALRSQAVILLPESRRRPLPSWILRSLLAYIVTLHETQLRVTSPFC